MYVCKKIILSLVLLTSFSSISFGFESLTCKSFDGIKSTATLVRLDAATVKLSYKFEAKRTKNAEGFLEFIKNKDDDIENYDSPYDESVFSFISDALPKNLKVTYVLTSDGPDYLYFMPIGGEIISSLSCK